MKMLKFCTLLGLILVIGATTACAVIRMVPSTSYPTIQSAIVAANNGDSIAVSPGTYHERLDFLTKNLVVTSHWYLNHDTAFINTTILDADSGGSAVVIMGGQTTAAIFQGFTVKHGTGHIYEPGYGTFQCGGGFFVINASPTIWHNLIMENSGPDGGGGIFCAGGSPIIKNNKIQYNHAMSYGCGGGIAYIDVQAGLVDSNYIRLNDARYGGGVSLKNSSPGMHRNVVDHNTAINEGGGIRIYSGSGPTLINNTFSHNTSYPNYGGNVSVSDFGAPVFMNNIVAYATEGCGFRVIGVSPTPVLSFNLFYENFGGNYVGLAPGTGDVVGNPAFVGGLASAYDYHLTSTSAAINAGNPDPAYNDPDQTRNDIGAFYFYLGPPTPIVLASFSASANSGNVTLSWITASQINCFGWVVQRLTGQGAFVDLNAAAPVQAQGTGYENQSYSFTDQMVQAGQYSYRLKQIGLDNSASYSNPITVTVSSATVKEFSLSQNYPNPFNPQTSIVFSLPEAGAVKLAIYDLTGRMVQVLVSGFQSAGQHNVAWRADGLSSGTYMYRLEAGQQIITKQLVLVK
jgi:parallel beta-helix repeat protein